ncbi:hypothetical protein JCM11251_007167 [Rhodosporidiobolus azoricus]
MSVVRSGSYTLSNGGPTLAYTVHLPSTLSTDSSRPTKAALVAHPFGRLGGSKDDHVVVALAETLAEQGWAVVRYDARGAGESGGSASWTGAAEAEDYRELVREVVLPLILPPASTAPSSMAPDNTAQPTREQQQQNLNLLLCGYSFGSLAASSCPPPHTLPSHPHLTLRTSYLLISYPISVLWALTLFRSSSFTTALQSLVHKGENRVLAVYGDQDQFSAVEKLRAWSEGLKKEQANGGRFRVVEVEGADHFWQKRTKKREMLDAVASWLRDSEPQRSSVRPEPR